MRKLILLPLAVLLLSATEVRGQEDVSWLSRPPKACAEGAVSAKCKCGGARVSSGYCCGGVAQAGACPAAWVRFSAPGCYATGSALGTKGETLTIARAGTVACGALTCQANELCVTTDGAYIATESVTMTSPLTTAGDWCIEATYLPSGWTWTTASGNHSLYAFYPGFGANTAWSYVNSTTDLRHRVYTSAAAATDWAYALPAGSAAKRITHAFNGRGTASVDGVAQTMTTNPAAITTTAIPVTFVLGSRDGTGSFFVGFVRDLKFWNSATCQ